ncbi:MAG: acyl-CoA dehydrogenase family protein, partial [Planifilum fimeticola]
IEAAKWLVLNAAWTLDQGEDNRHLASMAKLFGANMGNRVVDRVLQIHGGMGYTKELPIERWYRDARVWRIYDGTDEIQRIIIARNLLKGYVKLGDFL